MSRTCLNCVHCGSRQHGNIICQHPSWEDEDAADAMNEIHPSFASMCSDYEEPEGHDFVQELERASAVGASEEVVEAPIQQP